MRCFYPVLLLGLAAPALGAPRNTAHVVKESISLPNGWVKHSTPFPNHVVSLRIGLPQPHFPTLERILYEVSDPTHVRYGQHLSKEEVEELVAPYPHSLNAVNDWLSTYGLGEEHIDRSPAKDWITITIPVSLVEEMLDTKYHVYQHEKDGDYLVRTTSYSLPQHLHEHIDTVQPTTIFGRFKPQKSNVVWLGEDTQDLQESQTTSSDGVSSSCNSTITLSCLQQIYKTVGYVPTEKGNSIGITGYDNQYPNFHDLQLYYADQRPDALGSSFRLVSVTGGKDPQTPSSAGVEADLDVEVAFGLTFPIPGTFYSTNGTPPFKPDQITPFNTNEPYAVWLDFVLRRKDTPLVVSTSYGDDEQTVPKSYAERVCKDLAQLGARGISLIFASGDAGVGDGNPDPGNQTCFTNDAHHRHQFIPAFPASCPFVTTVGATQHYPEIAVSRFFSGGGFSNYFKRPAYQDYAVQAYLDKLPTGLYKGLFNPHGRAYPDLSAQGDLFRIFVRGKAVKVGGTSASAPTLAGVVALLNDVHLKAKGHPLGFLNPLIYLSDVSATFNDVTVGNNAGCGTTGFNATEGWDPVTGFGTPNFVKLMDLILSS
ncbi:subtilisin-like protein [Amanita rubescens]|nr:subtilisin-like protein [Amanita rubescens]